MKKSTKNYNHQKYYTNQGGPLVHIIAAKAVCFKKRDLNIKNADKCNQKCESNGLDIFNNVYDVVSNGTENHLFLVVSLNKD